MRVLVISENPDLPEAKILVGMKSSGIEVVWAGSSSAVHLTLLKNSGIVHSSLKLPSKVSFSAIWEIRKILKRQNFEAIYSLSGRALSNALLATIGMPMAHVAYRGTMGHLSRVDPTSHLTFLNRRLRKIICVSHAVRNYLIQQGVPEQKLTTIYKGHDPSWYKPEGKLSRKALGLRDDVAVAICVANARPVKGVDILLESMLEVGDTLPLQLLCIGELRDRRLQKLLSHPKLKDRVLALGFRRDVLELMNISDFIVQPSRSREGLPKAVLEGMCLGKPALVTNVGGMIEVVSNFETGLVVESCSSRALAAGLIEMTYHSSERVQMGLRARKQMETKLSSAESISAYVSLFKSLR